MGWYQYYTLLEKYEGDLSKANTMEMIQARNGNPNNPTDALALAKRKYKEKYENYDK